MAMALSPPTPAIGGRAAAVSGHPQVWRAHGGARPGLAIGADGAGEAAQASVVGWPAGEGGGGIHKDPDGEEQMRGLQLFDGAPVEPGAWAQQMPTECLIHLFKSLRGLRDLVAVSQVCKRWALVSFSQSIWERQCRRRWPSVLVRGGRPFAGFQWRVLYAVRHLEEVDKIAKAAGGRAMPPVPIEDCYREKCPMQWESLGPPTRGRLLPARQCTECRRTVLKCSSWNQLQQAVDRGLYDELIEQSFVRRPLEHALAFPARREPTPLDDWQFNDWYHGDINRDLAFDYLKDQPEGSFLVRASLSRPHEYALSFVGLETVAHIRIIRGRDGYKLEGARPFQTVPALIEHYRHHPLSEEFDGYRLKLSAHRTLQSFIPGRIGIGMTFGSGSAPPRTNLAGYMVARSRAVQEYLANSIGAVNPQTIPAEVLAAPNGMQASSPHPFAATSSAASANSFARLSSPNGASCAEHPLANEMYLNAPPSWHKQVHLDGQNARSYPTARLAQACSTLYGAAGGGHGQQMIRYEGQEAHGAVPMACESAAPLLPPNTMSSAVLAPNHHHRPSQTSFAPAGQPRPMSAFQTPLNASAPPAAQFSATPRQPPTPVHARPLIPTAGARGANPFNTPTQYPHLASSVPQPMQTNARQAFDWSPLPSPSPNPATHGPSSPTRQEPPSYARCAMCSHAVQPEWRFCGFCGAALK